jgi:hypothetical protein
MLKNICSHPPTPARRDAPYTGSGVLTSLKGSTYRKEYASPSRSLRPCYKTFLNILMVGKIHGAA